MEPVDILESRALCLATYVPAGAPDQLCRDGFEDRLNHGIVVTISLAAHGYSEAMLRKTRLIRARTVLRPAIPMMNAALGRLPQRHGHVQHPDRQVPFHTTADSPTNDAPRMQIVDDGQIQPPFAGPDMGSVARPLPVWAIRRETLIQQIGRSVERVVAIGLAPGSPYRRAVCGSLGGFAMHEIPAMKLAGCGRDIPQARLLSGHQ